MPQRQACLVLFLFGILVFSGCARVAEQQFAENPLVADLPELHQQNLRDGLLRMFGTIARPKLTLLPDPEEQDQDTEGGVESPVELVDSAQLLHGGQVYMNRCAGCHGVGGDGHGVAADYLRPKPRDYRKGVFKFTSTPYGDRPARQDLVRTIRRGAKGTSMPAFPWLANEDLEAVIDYVIYLSLRGRVEQLVVNVSEDYDEDEPIEAVEFNDALASERRRWEQANGHVVRAVSAEPAYDEASAAIGRELFIKSSCYSCHGVDAKGQTEWLSSEFLAAQEAAPAGERIQINYDAWGDPAPAADITARMLHGGRRPIDIYRRIYTGINGTPMPAFGQSPDFADNPDGIWHMVHYVMHIVDGGDPVMGINLEDVQQQDAD